jgi:hypothetical protein
MKLTLTEAIAKFGKAAKAKLASIAATGEPEDQLRAPFEELLLDLTELIGQPRADRGAVRTGGQTGGQVRQGVRSGLVEQANESPPQLSSNSRESCKPDLTPSSSKNGNKLLERAWDALVAGDDQSGQASLICFPGKRRTL